MCEAKYVSLQERIVRSQNHLTLDYFMALDCDKNYENLQVRTQSKRHKPHAAIS